MAPLGLVVYDGTPVGSFAVTILVTLLVGTALWRLTEERTIYAREAFLMMALAWLAVAPSAPSPSCSPALARSPAR